MLAVSGMPYDTIRGVIFGEGNGSLKDFGISFEKTELTEQGKFDKQKIKEDLLRLGKSLKMVYIQRSADTNSATRLRRTKSESFVPMYVRSVLRAAYSSITATANLWRKRSRATWVRILR